MRCRAGVARPRVALTPGNRSAMQTAAPARPLEDLPRPDPLSGTWFFLWTFRICVFGALILAGYLGGPLTRMAAILAALCAPFADAGGAARHVSCLVGLALGVAGVPSLGVMLGELLAPAFGNSVGLIAGAVTVVGGGLLAGAFVGRVLTAWLHRSRYLYVLNRTCGTLLGVAEGMLLAVALCWALSLFAPAIHMYAMRVAITHPRVSRILDYTDQLAASLSHDDVLGRWAADANPLLEIPTFAAVAAISEVAAHREIFWEAWEEGAFDDLIEDPVVQPHFAAFRADPDLRHAVKIRDLTKLLTSPQFTRAMRDDKLCRRVAAHWPKIRARVSEEKLQTLRALAAKLDDTARDRVREAERRARQFGVHLPEIVSDVDVSAPLTSRPASSR